jgi:hypothetical protein
MAETLITSGAIDPTQWPLARVWLEVSTALGVAPRTIDRLEFWRHQIWVKLVDGRATLVSFRALPLWIEQGLEAVQRCCDRPSLDRLGDIFSTEIARYGKHYSSETLEQWRRAWGQRAQQLRAKAIRQAQEEERLKPIRDRQQACQQWRESWRTVLQHCRSLEFLDTLAPELERQIQDFSDLPEGQTAMQLWHDRRRELIQATA